MSKRARELMDTMTPIITRALYGFDDASKADAKIEALIDDFARKERERAAERLRNDRNQYTDDNDGTGDPCNVIAVDDAISAVLANEED